MQEYVKIKNSKPTQVGRSAGKPSQQEKMQAGFKLKKGKSKAKTNAWSFATHLFKWKDSDLRPQASLVVCGTQGQEAILPG